MNSRRLHFLPLALLAASLAAPSWGADDGVSVAFSQSDKPRTLRIDVPMADVSVVGADVDKVTVVSDVPAVKPEKRKDGLRVIASGSSFELVEKDNVVTLSQDHGALRHGGGDFKITVPRDVKVVCRVEINGDVKVKDVRGDLEVSNLNGSIDLQNVAGSVSAETMNGEIKARYTTLAAGKVHAFSSMNGEIELLVPADAKATFRLRAQNGTVLTDLDEAAFVTRTESNNPPEGKAITITSQTAVRVESDKARAEADRIRSDVDRARAEADRARDEIAAAAPEAPESPRGAKSPKPPKPPKPPRVSFPSFGGQIVVGTFNGGGVEIRANTMNGEIKIRQAK